MTPQLDRSSRQAVVGSDGMRMLRSTRPPGAPQSVRQMQTGLHLDGPDHLGLWLIGLAFILVALITSGCG